MQADNQQFICIEKPVSPSMNPGDTRHYASREHVLCIGNRERMTP